MCKYRKKLLQNINIKSIFKEVEKESDFDIIECGYENDHIHILIQSKPKYSPLSIVRRLKQLSTKKIWLKYDLSNELWKEKTFWSDGYFISTVGNSTLNIIQQYIQYQGQFIPRS